LLPQLNVYAKNVSSINKYCKTGARFAILFRNHFFIKGGFLVKNFFSEKFSLKIVYSSG